MDRGRGRSRTRGRKESRKTQVVEMSPEKSDRKRSITGSLEKKRKQTPRDRKSSSSSSSDVVSPSPPRKMPKGKGKLNVALFSKRRGMDVSTDPDWNPFDTDISDIDEDSTDQSYDLFEVSETETESKVDQLAPTQLQMSSGKKAHEKFRSSTPIQSTSSTKASTSHCSQQGKASTSTPRIRMAQKCDICEKYVINIWRHRKTVHGQATSTKIQNQIVSRRGYVVKVCPIKNCDAVVQRLRDHLVRTHNLIKGSDRIKRLIKKAVPVTDQSERVVIERYKKNITRQIKREKTLMSKGIKIDEVIEISEDEEIKVKTDKTEIILVDDSEEEKAVEINMIQRKIDWIKKDSKDDDESEDEETTGTEGTDTTSNSMSSPTDEEISEDNETESKELFFENAIIIKFIKMIQRPPEMKGRKEALQHACQAYKLWGFLSKDRKLGELCNTDRLNDWILETLKHMAPGTVRSYLGSLSMFVGHLIRDGVLRKDIDGALRFKESIKLLSKGLRKKIGVRRTQKEVEEIETMITPQEVATFMESDVAKKTEQKIQGDIPLTVEQRDFLDIRNFILLRLILSNAQRPAAIRNISQQSIDRAKVTNEGAVVMVADHKTSEQGPATLGMTTDLFKMVLNYLKWIQILNVRLDPLGSIFITFPVNQQFNVMTTNNINYAIQSFWKKGPILKAINATRIRKATATHVRLALPSCREDLAAHMTHSPATADRHYALVNRRENALKMTKLIDSVMMKKKYIQDSVHWSKAKIVELNDEDTNDTENENEIIGTDKETEIEGFREFKDDFVENEPEHDLEDQEDLDVEESDRTEIEDFRDFRDDFVEKEPEHDLEDQGYENDFTAFAHKRRSFDPEQSALLIEICKKNIETGEIKMISVVNSLQGDERGIDLLNALKEKFGKGCYKKIVDRVRCEYRRLKKMQN